MYETGWWEKVQGNGEKSQREGNNATRRSEARETNMDSSNNFLTLCIEIKAVEEGEMMMIGFRAFLRGLSGCPPAVVVGPDEAASFAAAAAAPRSFSSSRESLMRAPTRARTDSKFCLGRQRARESEGGGERRRGAQQQPKMISCCRPAGQAEL